MDIHEKVAHKEEDNEPIPKRRRILEDSGSSSDSSEEGDSNSLYKAMKKKMISGASKSLFSRKSSVNQLKKDKLSDTSPSAIEPFKTSKGKQICRVYHKVRDLLICLIDH